MRAACCVFGVAVVAILVVIAPHILAGVVTFVTVAGALELIRLIR